MSITAKLILTPRNPVGRLKNCAMGEGAGPHAPQGPEAQPGYHWNREWMNSAASVSENFYLKPVLFLINLELWLSDSLE